MCWDNQLRQDEKSGEKARHASYLSIAAAYRQAQDIPESRRQRDLPTALQHVALSDQEIEQHLHYLWDSYILDVLHQPSIGLMPIPQRQAHLQDRIERYLRLQPWLETRCAAGAEKNVQIWRQRTIKAFLDAYRYSFPPRICKIRRF